MAVENLLRGVIVVGVLIIGGITASAVFDDEDDPGVRPAVAVAAPAVGGALPAPAGDLAPWSEEEAALAVDMSSGGTGQIEVELPGGFGFKLPADATTFDGSDFDIDGVGIYPGSTAQDLKVRILEKTSAQDGRALVTMGFSASDSPDKVVDWYEAEFAEAGIAATRTGNRIDGTTSEGKLFRLSVVPNDAGSRATILLR